MSALSGDVTVIGTGAGALSVAADLALGDARVTLADLPRFAGNLAPIEDVGGIRVQLRRSPSDDFGDPVLAPVAKLSTDPADATREAPVVIVSVPAFGHTPFAELLGPVWQPGQTVLWAGEGGGALTAVAEARRHKRATAAVHAETNTLPYAAQLREPGWVAATCKRGGTLVAALPAAAGHDAAAIARAVWPWASEADSVWSTVLTNYNAVDHVATLICNLGAFERPHRFRPWADGGTPGVVNVLVAVDDEYRSLRRALGVAHETPWKDYLVEQGMAAEIRPTAHETLHDSLLVNVEFAGGPHALEHRFLTEDVPYSLVLAADVGDAVGVDTPVIDGLITLASAATGNDFRTAGRKLADWGLGGRDADGLRQAARDGAW